MTHWLQAWLDRLGAAGVLALGVLLFCVPFYFSALAPAARELELQRRAAERPQPGPRTGEALASMRAAELQQLYALFPPVARLSDELERLNGLARGAKLELPQGEYRLETGKTGLVSYRVTLPVHGSHQQIRDLIRAVLREMPIASLDTVRFERKKIGETELDAQLRFTIYFSPRAMPQAQTAVPGPAREGNS